jgi:hypothetical protein
VEDNDFVPERAAGIDGGDVRHCQGRIGEIRCYIWCHYPRRVRIRGGFRARFDLHRSPNVVRSIGGDGGIPKQQALPVRIVWIGLDASKIGRHLAGLEQSSE